MKIFKICYFFLAFASVAEGQTPTDVFDLKKITWFGIDCSHLKCIGSYAEWGDEHKIVYEGMPNWNKAVIEKPRKYNLGKTFNHCDVDIDLKIVQKINFDINPDSLVYAYLDPPLLKEEEIIVYIKKYISQDRQGWGAVFLAENFNRRSNKAIVDIIIFDISTGKIGLMRRLTTKTNVYRLKNIPLKAILSSMGKIKQEWNNWKIDTIKK